MKLNLGCGKDYRPGFVNIDARSDVEADLVLDITRKLPFADGSVDEVLAQDVLEHLTPQQLSALLQEVSRVLRLGGRLCVRLPDIDAVISRFAADPDTRNLFLYGDTSQSGVWGAHKSGYTLNSFAALCLTHHFKLLNYRSVDTNYELEFSKRPVHLQPKKILFVNQSLGTGGAETFNTGLLAWLRKQGIQVSAWVTHPRFAKQLSARRLPVILDIIGDWKGLVKALVLWPLGVIMYAVVLWQNQDADIVLLTGFIEKIIITPLAKLLRMGVVWIEFGPLETVFDKFWGLPKLLYRAVSHLPDAVVMPTYNTLSHNLSIGRISRFKVKVIPCAEDIGPRPVQVEKDLVVCVSRLEPGKGQDLLLLAWPQVLRSIPTAKLRIVGEGELYASLVSLAHNLKNVTLTGWVQDAIAEVAKAKVCVFPSVWPLEGFGLAMIEAMSQNKPVVAFAVGPAPEIVDRRSGVLVPAGDLPGLADAIIKMLRHPVIGSRQTYLRRYTFSQIGPQYLDVLKYVMATHQAI